jgi:hypothetical protein
MAKLSLVPADAEDSEDDDYKRLAKLADKTTVAARKERRAILARSPELALRLGHVAHHLEDDLIQSIGGTELLADAIPEKCRQMRRGLAYKESSELETLIDRVILTWLHLQRAELDRRANTTGVTLAKATFYHREASRAQSDHAKAIAAW